MRATLLLLLLIVIAASAAAADSPTLWVMCQPDSDVNIRGGAGASSAIVGHAYLGDGVTVDKLSGEWAHCIDLPCEAGEGWINVGYLSDQQPTVHTDGEVWATVSASGRVAARRAMGGERRMWLTPSSDRCLRVWAQADEWSVTDAGFVKSKYLQEVDKP